MGPLSVVVVYAPPDQSTVEDKEQFYSDLDRVVSRTNGLAMVMRNILMQLLGRVYRGLSKAKYERFCADAGEAETTTISA